MLRGHDSGEGTMGKNVLCERSLDGIIIIIIIIMGIVFTWESWFGVLYIPTTFFVPYMSPPLFTLVPYVLLGG